MLTGGEEAVETAKAKFVGVFDKFFDILNVSNFTNGTKKRKRFQHPYQRADDFRLAVSVQSVSPPLQRATKRSLNHSLHNDISLLLCL